MECFSDALSGFDLRVESTELEGRTVVATRRFEKGEVVLKELPLYHWDNTKVYDYVKRYFMASPEVQQKVMNMESHLGELTDHMELRWIANSISRDLKEKDGLMDAEADLVYHLLQIKRTNAHSYRSGAEATGGALFELASLVNHSCKPNVAYSTYDEHMRFIATEPIEMNEQIRATYLSDLLIKPRQIRQRKLFDTKDFVCRCERCLGVDDCRGFRCAAVKRGSCNSIVYQSNSGESWSCSVCSISVNDEKAQTFIRMVESRLLDRFNTLESKFNAAVEPMSPSDFNDFIGDAEKLGIAKHHYLVLQVLRLLVLWSEGQAESIGDPNVQFMAPWGKPCSKMSFLRDAIITGVQLVQKKECVSVCCNAGDIIKK